jgi:hypothetical protein
VNVDNQPRASGLAHDVPEEEILQGLVINAAAIPFRICSWKCWFSAGVVSR